MLSYAILSCHYIVDKTILQMYDKVKKCIGMHVVTAPSGRILLC